MKICFIGHKTIGFGPIKERLIEAVKNEIAHGGNYFLMGVRGEFDAMALSVCRELRQIYSHIKIDVVLTSLHTIEKKLVDGEIEHPYNDVSTIFFEIEDEYFKNKIIASNKKMVDCCDTLICYVNKKRNPSGAKLIMNYAKRKGLKIINLYSEKDEPTYNMSAQEKKRYLHEKFYQFLNKK